MEQKYTLCLKQITFMAAKSDTNSDTPYQVAGRVVRDSQLPELLMDEMRSRGHSYADVSSQTGIERTRLQKIVTRTRPVAPVRTEILMYIFELPRITLEPLKTDEPHLGTLDRLANLIEIATDLSPAARRLLLGAIEYVGLKEGETA